MQYLNMSFLLEFVWDVVKLQQCARKQVRVSRDAFFQLTWGVARRVQCKTICSYAM